MTPYMTHDTICNMQYAIWKGHDMRKLIKHDVTNAQHDMLWWAAGPVTQSAKGLGAIVFFCIRGIGLSKKRIIGFGSVFYDIGLKSQHLRLKTKRVLLFFLMFPAFFKIFILEILFTLFTMTTQSMWFAMWKRHLLHSVATCVVSIRRINHKSGNIRQKHVFFWF